MARNKQFAGFDMKGLGEVKRNLGKLSEAVRGKAEKAVLRAGAAPVRKAARRYALASQDSGLLRKALGSKVKTVRGKTTARIGVRGGFRGEVLRTDARTGKKRRVMANPVKYAHLVEYGTAHSAAKPFMVPAIEETKGQVVDAMAKGLEKHVSRTVERMRRA